MSATASFQPRVHGRDGSFRLFSDCFYFSMSLLIMIIVVYGFAQRAEVQLIHPLHPKPLVMWIHAVVFVAWVLFYISQSALVRAHNVSLHRTMGWFGVALGATLPILGSITLIVMRVLICNTAI